MLNRIMVLSFYTPWVSGGGHRPVCFLEEDIRKGREVVFVYVSESEAELMKNHQMAYNSNLKLAKYEKETNTLSFYDVEKGEYYMTVDLYKFALEWRPDIVRSHNPVQDYINFLCFCVENGLPHVYDQMDYWDGFPVKPWGEGTEKKYIELASCCVTISYWLENKNEDVENMRVIPNGIKRTFLDKLMEPDVSKVAAHFENLDKCVLYVGAIWPEWFDWDVVKYIVKARPEYKFIFIGPYISSAEEDDGRAVADIVKEVSQYGNAVFLGQIAHEDIIPWLKRGKVGLIPFVVNDVTEACSPLKCYEYLSAYLPVVSSALPEITDCPSVSLTSSKEEFLQEIDRYINTKREEEDYLMIKEFNLQNTWECRSNVLDDVMMSAIRKVKEKAC